MTQPAGPRNVPQGMGPYEIARSRLLDFATGAHPDLLSQADAIHVANHLDMLETSHERLRSAVGPLEQVLAQVDITAGAPIVIALGRVLDNINREMTR